MCVFIVISDERVPSGLKELLLGVLFLFINENILSSPAFECGIVIITSATLNSRSNSKVLVPAVLTPFRNPQSTSTPHPQDLSSP